MIQKCRIHENMPGDSVDCPQDLLVSDPFLPEPLHQLLPFPFGFKVINHLKTSLRFYASKINKLLYRTRGLHQWLIICSEFGIEEEVLHQFHS
jgi:hypothetical protein